MFVCRLVLNGRVKVAVCKIDVSRLITATSPNKISQDEQAEVRYFEARSIL